MEPVIIIKKKKDPKFNNTPEYNKEYYAKHKREILAQERDLRCIKCKMYLSSLRETNKQTTNEATQRDRSLSEKKNQK